MSEALDHVGAIYACRAHLDENLARVGTRHGRLYRPQHLRSAGVGDPDRGHSLRQIHRLAPCCIRATSTVLTTALIDSNGGAWRFCSAMDAEDLPRPRGDAASLLAKEALDTYSQDELLERVATLEAEIARVKAHHARAADHRQAADALFRPKGTD